MNIYLAGGYPLIIREGREQELAHKLGFDKRLYSFADYFINNCPIVERILEHGGISKIKTKRIRRK